MNDGAQSTTAAPPPSGLGLQPALRLPELLAPAGDWECARAAVENGADGIYFGVEQFNARMRAHNFTVADLPELMAFLHRRGVKGYITFNTLVFAEELKEAEAFLRAIIRAGVDAAIVQDVGMARMIRALSPDFPIHASTQMTVTSAAGVEFVGELGCERVILARECSLQEIAKIQQALVAAASRDASRSWKMPELEVFVHGALCVAYSGQCLTSESLGGRSANRGECAQACRMPFELICDGQPVPLGDRRYLLSPQDLAALELLPELVRLGLASVKIEGRLKSPEYVANITRVYRQALDQLGTPGSESQPQPVLREDRLKAGLQTQAGPAHAAPQPVSSTSPPPATNVRHDLEMSFSRGLYTGWLGGINNQELVHARFGKKRGVHLGRVGRLQGEKVFLRLEGPVKPGDGVVFDAGRPDQEEQGGRVYEVRQTAYHGGKPPRGSSGPALPSDSAPEVMLAFGRGDIDFGQLHVGDHVWKTSDPELDKRIRRTFEGSQPRWLRPITMEVEGAVGQPMNLTVDDGTGHVVRCTSNLPLARAENQPLTADRLREQLGRLGGTPFRLAGLKCGLEGDLILPLSELNRLRREAVAALDALRAQPRRWTLREGGSADEHSSAVSVETGPGQVQVLDRASTSSQRAELTVLVRNLEQLEAAWRSGVSTLYCELEDPRKYREAVARFRAWQATTTGVGSPAAILAAPPRITKPGEEWILKLVRACEADGWLLRNCDQLQFFTEGRRLGDFSFNVANPGAAEYFIRRHHLERVTASYDLNADQLIGLLRAAPPEWFEITLHQHMPMFHMEHCVFCAFLSKGTDYTDCGRPCEKHTVALRDRVGARHPVKADAGCRNTVYNALAQTGAESVGRLLALGARRFRVEFLDESPESVARTIAMYQRLLRGEVSASELWRELKLINRLGVTRGQMESGDIRVPKWGEIEW